MFMRRTQTRSRVLGEPYITYRLVLGGDNVTARAAAAKPVGSVVVVFELMTQCQHHHMGRILDLVQRYVTGATERDH